MLLDAAALLGPRLTREELRGSAVIRKVTGRRPTNRKTGCAYPIPANALERLSQAQATCLLQKLDFLKYVYRLRGIFQSGRYAGQAYEAVWLFEPDYIEYVGQVNRFIFNRTQPLKVLQWLKRNKPKLFESALLPSFDELLQLCANQPNRFHDVARRALEGSPEFLQMQAQHRKHRASLLGRRSEGGKKPEPAAQPVAA